MFSLSSLPNLIISTLVFIGVAWYANRVLDAQEIPKGLLRGLLVFALAYLVSWGCGESVDWLAGTPVSTQSSPDLVQLLRAATSQKSE